MKIETFQGVVENGLIRLTSDAHLPEQATVYVIVPQPSLPPRASIPSVHLAHPDQAKEFELELLPERRDA